MLRNLFLKTVRDLNGQIWGWGLGIGVLGILVLALFPAFKNQVGAFAELLKSYPPALLAFFGDITQMGTFSGWLNVELFSYVPPILAIFGVVAGTGLIAGEEEKGTLDLLLSQPIRRWRVVVEKWLALAAAILAISILIALCLVATAAAIGQTQDLDRIVLASLDMVPITLASGSLAFAASVLFRRRRWATTLAAVVVIGSWFVDSLGKVVNQLKPYRPFTLFHYFNGGALLAGGSDWSNAAVLLGLAVLFGIIAVVAFQRRDIAV